MSSSSFDYNRRLEEWNSIKAKHAESPMKVQPGDQQQASGTAVRRRVAISPLRSIAKSGAVSGAHAHQGHHGSGSQEDMHSSSSMDLSRDSSNYSNGSHDVRRHSPIKQHHMRAGGVASQHRDVHALGGQSSSASRRRAHEDPMKAPLWTEQTWGTPSKIGGNDQHAFTTNSNTPLSNHSSGRRTADMASPKSVGTPHGTEPRSLFTPTKGMGSPRGMKQHHDGSPLYGYTSGESTPGGFHQTYTQGSKAESTRRQLAYLNTTGTTTPRKNGADADAGYATYSDLNKYLGSGHSSPVTPGKQIHGSVNSPVRVGQSRPQYGTPAAQVPATPVQSTPRQSYPSSPSFVTADALRSPVQVQQSGFFPGHGGKMTPTSKHPQQQLFQTASAPQQPAPALSAAASQPQAAAVPSKPSAAAAPAAASSSNSSMPNEAAVRQKLKQFVTSWAPKYHENYNAYREGGYLTVKPGDTLDQRYELLRKLGWGEFSTVWLAHDHKASSAARTFVAVKVSKCSNSVVQGTKYEMNLLNYMRNNMKNLKTHSPGANLATTLHTFEHRGQYGSHLCMVFPLLGPNLLCIVDQMKARRQRRSQREYLMVKSVIRGLLQGLVQLEAMNVVHTDLKPENVLCSVVEPKVLKILEEYTSSSTKSRIDQETVTMFADGDVESAAVTIADFGLSFLLVPPTSGDAAAQRIGSRNLKVLAPGVAHNATGVLIQTREYRSPEVLFGMDFSTKTDLWSVGCMVFELLTGEFLLDPKRKTRNEHDMDIEHVAMMRQLLGDVPFSTATGRGKHLHKFFDSNTGAFLYEQKYAAYQRRNLVRELELYLGSASESTAAFIMACLGGYDLGSRISASQLLQHPWLKQ